MLSWFFSPQSGAFSEKQVINQASLQNALTQPPLCRLETTPLNRLVDIHTVSGCVAQRESTAFTRQGSQVQSLSHPPLPSPKLSKEVCKPYCFMMFLQFLRPLPSMEIC